MTDALLQVSDLTITVPAGEYGADRRPVVSGVNLQIGAGEALGLVGESGSGKSMTARAVMRLFVPGVQATGTVVFDGRDVFAMEDEQLRLLRAHRIAMIFQDPRAHINPVRTVGAFLIEGLCASGVSTRDADRRVTSLLAEVGISDGSRRMAQLPHELSGGLLQRVMIASAVAMDPDLLLADEPTTALDVTTQSEVMAILAQLRTERGLALLFITHDLELAAATCDSTAVMYAGSIVERQSSRQLLTHPYHPYSSGLMVSRPDLDVVRQRLPVIEGQPIAAFEAGEGCAFAPRCGYSQPACLATTPALVAVQGGEVACHRASELQGQLPTAMEGGGDV